MNAEDQVGGQPLVGLWFEVGVRRAGASPLLVWIRTGVKHVGVDLKSA